MVMVKYFAVFFISFLFMGGCSSPPTNMVASSRSPLGEISGPQQAVWKIQDHSKKSISTCTYIASNKCATSLTAIEKVLENTDDLSSLFLSQEEGSRHLQINKISNVSVIHNIAIVETHQNIDRFLQNIRQEEPQKNENLYLLGYSNGFFKRVDKIKHSKTLPLPESAFTFPSKAFFSDMLGSPVFDSQGRFVGAMFSISNFSSLPHLAAERSNFEEHFSESNIANVKSIKPISKVFFGKEGTSCSKGIQDCIQEEKEAIRKASLANNPSAQYHMAMDYIQKGKITEAVPFLQKAARRDHTLAKFQLSSVYISQKKIDKAKDVLRQISSDYQTAKLLKFSLYSHHKSLFKEGYRTFYQLGLNHLLEDSGFLYLDVFNILTLRKVNDVENDTSLNEEDLNGLLKSIRLFVQRGIKLGSLESQRLLGRTYLRVKDRKKAEELFVEGAKQNYSLSQIDLGDMFLQDGKLGKAEKWFLEAEKSNQLPVVLVAHVVGQVYLKNGMEEKGEKQLRIAAELNHVPAQIRLVNKFLARGRGEAEEAKFEEWFKKGVEKGSYHHSVRAMFELAKLYNKQGELNKARKLYEQTSKNGMALKRLKLMFLEIEIEELEKHGYKEDQEETHAPAYYKMVFSHEQQIQNAYQEAQKADQEAQTQKAKYLREVAASYHKERSWDWVVAAARKGHPKAQSDYGITLVNKGKPEKGEKWLIKGAKHLLKKDGYKEDQEETHAPAYYKMVEKYYNEIRSLQNNSQNLPEPLLKALIHNKNLRLRAWIVVAARKGHPKAQSDYGIILVNEGKPEEGEKWLIKGVKQGDSHSMFNLSGLLFSRGELDEAEKWLLEAEKAGASLDQVFLAFAKLYGKQGKLDKAIEKCDYGIKHGIELKLSNEATRELVRLKDNYHRENSVLQSFGYLRDNEETHPFAQYHLALWYFENTENVERPKDWLQLSANADFPDAQHLLGHYYYVYSDDWVTAEFWYNKAAELTHPIADESLEKLHFDRQKLEELGWVETDFKARARAEYALAGYYEDQKEYKRSLIYLNKARNKGFRPASDAFSKIQREQGVTLTLFFLYANLIGDKRESEDSLVNSGKKQ